MSDLERNVWSYITLQTTDITIEEGIPFEKWEELGERLNAFIETGRWGLGRWAEYGEAHFGDDYTRAVAPARSRRIDQALWVFRRVPPKIRRESLSWSHHRAIAGLDDRALQIKLLDAAEQGEWDVSTLAKAVSEAKRAGGKVTPPGEPTEVTSATRLFGRARERESAPDPAEMAAGIIHEPGTSGGFAVSEKCPKCSSPNVKRQYGGERGEAGPFLYCDTCEYSEEDEKRKGFTPRVVAGKDVEPPEDPHAFAWAVVVAARDAIAKGEITDDLRKAVADVDRLQAISKRSVG